MFQALTLAKKVAQREYFAIAPMVDISDRHFRYFMRLLSKNCFLYTEMLNEHAILYAKNGRDRLLSYHDVQHPGLVC
jgi:tRNA-dihydrouridine synthase A